MEFSSAIVRGISKKLISDAQRLDDSHEPINEELMQSQNGHDKYTNTLKELGLQIVELPSDENLPDCVFTEDAAVVCGKKAILTRLGHPNRRGEHVEMRKAFTQLGLEVFDMTMSENSNAFCDGGDVLFTGSEFFVGDSKRTTSAGADFIRNAFGLPVHVIKVGEELHLKSNCSLLCPGKIVFSDDETGQDLAKQFQLATKTTYEYIFVPDIKCSNVVYIKMSNGKEHILAPSGYSKSESILRAKIENQNINFILLNNSELGKVDGCLTCCSVLVQ